MFHDNKRTMQNDTMKKINVKKPTCANRAVLDQAVDESNLAKLLAYYCLVLSDVNAHND